jgi:hypothetical protein
VVGTVSGVKAVVKVYEVHDRMLLARTFRQRKTDVEVSYASTLSRLMAPPEQETLHRERPRYRMDDAEQDAVVRTGDIVEVFDGERDDPTVPRGSSRG